MNRIRTFRTHYVLKSHLNAKSSSLASEVSRKVKSTSKIGPVNRTLPAQGFIRIIPARTVIGMTESEARNPASARCSGLRQATNFNPAESAETTFSRREDEFRFDGFSETFRGRKHHSEGTYALELAKSNDSNSQNR